MSVRNLIKQSNVTLLCTTDDPIDDLKWHKVIKEDETFDVQVSCMEVLQGNQSGKAGVCGIPRQAFQGFRCGN